MPQGKSFFVVGTDTGVGKTTVSLAFIGSLRARGYSVAAMKPCETGDGLDAVALWESVDRASALALVNPYRFKMPAAPEIAARRAGSRIDFSVIEEAHAALVKTADVTVVEGAGGLLVPFTRNDTTVDLIYRLKLPVLIVARTALGTINHTLLTIEVARARGLAILGVVFSRSQEGPDENEAESIDAISRLGNVSSLGVLPYLPQQHGNVSRELGVVASAHLEVSQLCRALHLS